MLCIVRRDSIEASGANYQSGVFVRKRTLDHIKASGDYALIVFNTPQYEIR
jgi:hypothetical protein